MVLAFGGIFVAGMLSLAHVLNATVPCGANSQGCETVAQHPSSAWAGIPVAFFGLGAYFFLAALAFLRTVVDGSQVALLTKIGALVSGVGTALSLYLTYIALNEIHATCIWCLASAAIMSVTFLINAWLAQKEPNTTLGAKFDKLAFVGLFVVAFGGLGVYSQELNRKGAETGVARETLDSLTIENYATANPDTNTSLHVYGDMDSPVTIVEFADIFCDHCRTHYPNVKNLATANPGKVRVVFRHLPLYMLEGHDLSLPASILAEYAGEEGKFWDFMDAVMMSDKEQVKSASGLLKVIQTIGMDPDKARRVMSDTESKYFSTVYRDIELANSAGVSRTPTYLVFAPGHKTEAATPNNIAGIVETLVKKLNG